MVIVPSTNIILLKTPIELGDDNQLTWSTKQEQYNYFNSLPKLSLDEATYQRKDNEIRFPTSLEVTYEDLIQYNYCMYQNEAYDNKWFYAYITEIKYINDGMSTIKIETDVWNTWCFDLEIKQSFVEREHVNDDTIGLHTIPEGLETGEFLSSENSPFIYQQGIGYYPCVGVSDDLLAGNSVRRYNGIYSGLQFIALEDSLDLDNLLSYYADKGAIEEIVSIFMIPVGFISSDPIPEWTEITVQATVGSTIKTYQINCIEVPESDIEFNLGTKTISRPSQLGIGNNKYTPKNNKLLTSDYMYILVDNMCGNVVKYDYEYFSNSNQCTFQCYGAINPGCSIKTYPKYYKNVENNYSEGLTNAKLPVCGWVSDVYTNWLTQNGINIELSLLSGATQMLGGAMMMSTGAGALSGASSVTSGAMSIANTLGQVYSRSLAPRQAQGNTNVGDIMFSIGNITPMFYKMTIKEEYAKCIDSYFSMYGYKVNSLKVPNIRGRRNWNYVKTIGCNITGNIPQIDLEKIREQFDKGVTFWHNSNTFLDYSQNNDII